MTPVVIRNQGTETVWHPRRCDLPRDIVECQGSPCYLPCQQGRKCSRQQPVVPESQRYRIGFKTDSEERAEGWEPAELSVFWRLALRCVAALFAIILAAHVFGRLGVI